MYMGEQAYSSISLDLDTTRWADSFKPWALYPPPPGEIISGTRCSGAYNLKGTIILIMHCDGTTSECTYVNDITLSAN
jgi:hypothetical protein